MATEDRQRRIHEVVAARQQDVVLLEDIHDPHNAAAVLRTCDAVGIQTIYLSFQEEQHFNPRTLGKRSSASANRWLDFRAFASTRECLKELKHGDYWLVATVPDPAATSVFEFDFCRSRLALMFGSEQRGLSEAALALADARVRIPMLGMVRSLNLSVTAALCLYELLRQRQKAGPEKFLLPAGERAALEARWLQEKEPEARISGPAAESGQSDLLLRALGIRD